MVLAHRAFAEGQIEGRRQPPAPVTPKTPGEVLGMVVSVMEEHVEDGSSIGFLHLALIARQETGGTQKSGVVGSARQAKIHLQQSGQAMHRDALPIFPVEACDAKRGQLETKVKPTTFGHFQPAIPSQLRIELLNDTNLLVFILCRKFHQPGAAGRIGTCADLPSGCVVLHQRFGSGALRRSAGEREFAQGDTGLAGQRTPALIGQRPQGPVRFLGAGIARRSKAQSTHGTLADKSQLVQRSGMTQAMLAKQTIHQQQTPAIRKAVCDQAREAMQVGRKAPVGIGTQLQMQR